MSDFRKTDGEDVPLSSREAKTRFKKTFGFILVVVLIVAASLLFLKFEQKVPATGYVTTEDYAEVRASRNGRVKEILSKTGAEVSAGDILTRLDDSEALAMIEQSEKSAGTIRARIERLTVAHNEKRARHEKALLLAGLRLKDAETKLELTERLSEKGLASEMSLEDRRLARELAAVELEALKALDESLDEKDIAVLREELKTAEQEVALHRVRLEEYLVRAPVAGRVIRHEFMIGEVVGPDVVLYEIFGGDGLVLKIMVAERHAALVTGGQQYRAQLVPFRGVRRIWFHGEVLGSRDVIETRGKRTGRLLYCSFDPSGYAVSPGTSADVELFAGKAPLWRVLLGVYR